MCIYMCVYARRSGKFCLIRRIGNVNTKPPSAAGKISTSTEKFYCRMYYREVVIYALKVVSRLGNFRSSTCVDLLRVKKSLKDKYAVFQSETERIV